MHKSQVLSIFSLVRKLFNSTWRMQLKHNAVISIHAVSMESFDLSSRENRALALRIRSVHSNGMHSAACNKPKIQPLRSVPACLPDATLSPPMSMPPPASPPASPPRPPPPLHCHRNRRRMQCHTIRVQLHCPASPQCHR